MKNHVNYVAYTTTFGQCFVRGLQLKSLGGRGRGSVYYLLLNLNLFMDFEPNPESNSNYSLEFISNLPSDFRTEPEPNFYRTELEHGLKFGLVRFGRNTMQPCVSASFPQINNYFLKGPALTFMICESEAGISGSCTRWNLC